MTSPILPRPAEGEYAPFYAGYIATVPDVEIVKFLETQLREARALLSTVPEGRGGHAYATGKWTIKEVIGHVCDAERIFSYRALRIARGDMTPLPGFEQDDYVRTGQFGKRTMASLVNELVQVRDSTMALVQTLDVEAGARKGEASGKGVTTRALVWIIAGHMAHHVAVLREKYGVGVK